MLLTSKELNKMIKSGVSYRSDKMFSLKNDLRTELNNSNHVKLLAYIDKKPVTLKSAIDTLELPIFTKVYNKFKEVEKEKKNIKSSSIRIAQIRKVLEEYFKDDAIALGYMNLLCSGEELENFRLYKVTMYSLDFTIQDKSTTIELVKTEYAENGMIKSELVIDNFTINTLGVVLTDLKEKYREKYINLQIVAENCKNTGGMRKAIKDLPEILEALPQQIKTELENFIKAQCRTKIDDIKEEYSDIFEC